MKHKAEERSTRVKKTFLPPGTLVYTGMRSLEKPVVTVFDYSPDNVSEQTLDNAEQCRSCKNSGNVAWINVNGLGDVETIGRIGRDFDIHQLVLEDILHTAQRPKFEDLGDYFFIVTKMLGINADTGKITEEQVSFVVRNNLVITFQEYPGDVFEAIRNRIRKGQGQIRDKGADYLAYALLDAIIDNYFVVLEQVGEEAENIENELAANTDEAIMHRIHSMKRRMISLRRSVWPLREVVNGLLRSESPLITERTHIYFKDLYDHTVQVIDIVESLRDLAGGMLDTYLSAISNRMNSVMKVLTIIATIFIPLTFIAGIYGMNFEYMPELRYPWAYPAVLALMVLISLGMLAFFKSKKWI